MQIPKFGALRIDYDYMPNSQSGSGPSVLLARTGRITYYHNPGDDTRIDEYRGPGKPTWTGHSKHVRWRRSASEPGNFVRLVFDYLRNLTEIPILHSLELTSTPELQDGSLTMTFKNTSPPGSDANI